MSRSPRKTEGSGGDTDPRPDASSVERIGKYEIVGLLGKGGMGAVYRAFDPFLERAVAIKIMLPQIAEDPEHKQRFEREARAVARLTHPNVITVFDLGYHTDGAPYIVMELLQGDDLLHILGRGTTLRLAQKVSIVLQVLDGLGQAHQVGIVHRDVKPANVFITSDGAAKIMDFGIARLGPAGATAAGAVLGTAAYMSPEQVNGERVDARSDLFSVASLLCELLTGRRPFEAETPMATMYRIAHKEPDLELPTEPEYERFGPVLKRALARNPDERYATSAEFAEALTLCLDDTALKARARVDVGGEGEIPHLPSPGNLDTTAPVPGAPAHETSPPSRRHDPSGLFRILRDVYVGGKSGHLHFSSGGYNRSLRMLKGRITHAISDRPGEHLGEVLVRYGVISQGVLERALETEKRLGPVLSGQGLLGGKGLADALGLHVREILFAMLAEAGGSHTFEELPDSASEAEVASSLSTGQVILEATRRVLDPEMIRQVLGDMDRVLVLSSDPLLRSQPITLTPTDGFVLSRVDGTLSARDVVSMSPVPPEDTERSLFGLICTGIVDYKKKSPTSRTRPHARPAAARNEPATPTPAGPPEPPEASATPTPTSTAENDQTSTPVPSEAAAPEEPPAPTPARAAESEEASTSTPPEAAGREESPTPVAPMAAEPGETVAPASIGAAEANETSTPAPPNPAPPDDSATLAPPPETDPEESGIVAPPEAEPEESGIMAPPEAEPQESGNQAPPQATRPASGTKAGPVAEPDPRETGADEDPGAAIREAEGLFAEERYDDAIQKVAPLVSVVSGSLKTRAAILLARSYTKGEDGDGKAEGVLLRLVEEDPTCTPGYFFLGDLYRSRNQIDRARSMYRKILELAPRHRGAAAELASLGEEDRSD